MRTSGDWDVFAGFMYGVFLSVFSGFKCCMVLLGAFIATCFLPSPFGLLVLVVL